MFVIGKNLPEVLKAGLNLQNEMELCCVRVVSAGTGGLEEGRNLQKQYDRLYLQCRGAYTLYMHPNLPVPQV